MPCIWCDRGTCIIPGHAVVREYDIGEPDDLPPLVDDDGQAPEPIPIFDLSGQSLQRLFPRPRPLPEPLRRPPAYTRFWDLHLTDHKGWYDFCLNILPEVHYQERKNANRPGWRPSDGRIRVSWRIARAFRASLRAQLSALQQMVEFCQTRQGELAGLGNVHARRLTMYFQNDYGGELKGLEALAQQPEVKKQLSIFSQAIADAQHLLQSCWRTPHTKAAEFGDIRRRLDTPLDLLREYRNELTRLEGRLVDYDPDDDDAPASSYFATIISMEDIARQLPSGLGGSMVQWISHPLHRGKLRVSSHGDGKGHLCMEDDRIRGSLVGDWLHVNGLEPERQPDGQRQDRAGVKGERGLLTINLSICMGGLGYDTKSSTHIFGALQVAEQYTQPGVGSAVDQLVRRLAHHGVHGIEVTGSNLVVRDEGGRLGEVEGDDWTLLAHSARKIRAIS
ncbi:hypothetical protein LXT21_34165 [Myxococcus sp. K38C18041901]|uniref:hypothetical protein n=1 Tax=Myxococcus guangdongensis TaxID=2906760 RepID=UPI0020A80812|nr:hypothetical protein [Myxococcus guangdongensis]MCP3063833.1 hypothetical protein [Myxococcus guangdongensis]